MDEIRDKVKGNHIFTFCRGYSDHSERKIASVLGTLDHEGLVSEYFVFCFHVLFSST